MITFSRLDEGARLVIEEIPYLRSAAVGVYIQVGSRDESSGLEGCSHFVEHMLFKGTSKRNAREIAEDFESIGGQVNAFTSKEYTGVYVRTLDEDIYSGMDMIFDMLFDSQMVDKEYGTEREVIKEEIGMYEDTPDELIHDVFAGSMWGSQRMGHSILGTIDSLNQLKRSQLFDFYKDYYNPRNMVIAVAGNVKSEKVIEAVQHRLSDYCAGGGCTAATASPATQSGQRFVSTVPKEIEQVQICVGVPSINYHSEDRYTQNVFNTLLGGGMSSRLFQSLREEKGLAYSVYSAPSSYSDTGIFAINIGTGQSKIGEFFDCLHSELDKITSDGVNIIEVDRAKKQIKSSVLLGLESVMNRMTRLAKAVLMYDRVVTVDEVIEKVEAVDVEMINKLAGGLFKTGGLSMAAIGDKKVLPVVEQEFSRWWA